MLLSCLQMHATSEMDELAVTKKEPAIHKLQALKAVEELLLQRKYHDAFLHQKGLEAMNRWGGAGALILGMTAFESWAPACQEQLSASAIRKSLQHPRVCTM